MFSDILVAALMLLLLCFLVGTDDAMDRQLAATRLDRLHIYCMQPHHDLSTCKK